VNKENVIALCGAFYNIENSTNVQKFIHL